MKTALTPFVFVCLFLSLGCKSNSSNEETNFSENGTQSIRNELIENDSLFQVHLCTELFPPIPNSYSLLDTQVYYRNGNVNDTLISSEYAPQNKGNKIAQLAIETEYIWPYKTLKVVFLDGQPSVQEKVILAAKEWEKHCGIKFDFGNHKNPDISISFIYSGSWSYIGSYSKKVHPSMNFGWLDESSSEKEYSRVVLHEFGHALGFIHEHLSPQADIPWNTQRVYRYYMGPPNNWDKITVDRNIFQKYSKQQVNNTRFDENSIMLYEIPSFLTLNGYSTKSNSQLSELDKQFVAEKYPKTN